jgi:hypothetical protein
MADYEGQVQAAVNGQAGSGDRVLIARGTTATANRPTPPTTITVKQFPGANLSGTGDKTAESLIKRFPSTDVSGYLNESPGLNWFEMLHAYPISIELGNMLSTVVRDIVIYSSFRELTQTLDTATNNAGTGISFVDLPTLPANIYPNAGTEFQVEISQQGQPSIDGTLDFTTSFEPLSIPITGSRVVMMAYEPVGPVQETLEFVTDIMRSADGHEQRVSVRSNPRQIIDYRFLIPEGDERRRMETFLYKWHSQVFGIPVWFESQRLTAAATSGDTVLSLPTEYSDFRIGGLLIVWSDYLTFDALEISAVTSTTITLTSGITRDYPSRTKVMPLRTALTKQEISGDKFAVNLSSIAIKFYVSDNEEDIASAAAFGTHNSKVMFNDPNWIPRETNTDTLKRLLHKMDNNVGSPIQFTDWVNSHMVTSKGFFCRNPQALWEMRQVLHHLNGRQKSFYLPTFYFDLVVNQELVLGNTIMDIDLMGYVDFIDGNEPNKSLYVELNDGTILTRQVTSSVVLDSTTERLTLDDTWPYDIAVSEIKRVSFLRLGRFANDTFAINHNNSGQATLKATVQGVIQ